MVLFKNATPGSGYYGKEKGRIRGNKITLPEDDGTPAYNDIRGMASAVLDEAINLDPAFHRTGYGGLVHVINHAAAIADLADYGYPELAKRAVASHREHLRLWRDLPNVADEQGPMKTVCCFSSYSRVLDLGECSLRPGVAHASGQKPCSGSTNSRRQSTKTKKKRRLTPNCVI